MVFFTCNACGESLKKAQVEKHVNMCRGCQVLSCMDCGHNFWGNDYKTHIKCISEDQKYGGKGYEAKANKGDVKQQQWLQRVHEAMNKPGVTLKLRNVLQQISTYDNVPRKKAKFQNWMKNSLKIASTSLQEEVWDILIPDDNAPEATKPTEQTVAEVKVDTNENAEENGHPDVEEKKKKKLNKQERKEARQQKNGKATKGVTVTEELEQDQTGEKKKKNRKRKRDSEEAEDLGQNSCGAENKTAKMQIDNETEAADMLIPEETEDQVTQGKFNWKGNIKAVLRESPDQEMSVKKLRKKVLAAYYSFTGDRNFKTDVELQALFNKKINKNPKFRVLKDRVRLLK